MASAHQLPSGKWRGVAQHKGTIDRATFETERAALGWAKRREIEMEDGTYVARTITTVAAWLQEWLDAGEGDIEASTYAQRDQHVRLHLKPVVGLLKLSDLQPTHVQRIYTTLKRTLSASMAHKVSVTFAAALKEAHTLRLIATNPALGIKKPRPGKRESKLLVWDREQVRAFLRASEGQRWEALFHLAIDTGMRQGELFALHWPEVDLDAGTVQVIRSLGQVGELSLKPPKTECSRRILRICERTRDLLAELWEHRMGELVFTNTRGGFLSKTNFHKNDWKPMIERAGVPQIGFHGMRHTCATLLLTSGVNIKAVSSRLGHSSIRITLDTYSHVMPEMDDKIVSVMGRLMEPKGKEE